MATALDQIKTAAVAATLGSLSAACVACFALAILAKQNGTQLVAALGYVWTYPISVWPSALQLWTLATPAVIGLTISALFYSALRGLRWTFGQRKLASAEAFDKMLSKSTINGTRIFAGTFGNKRFFTSIEDRALVIGPPGTGKTTFLFNQLLRSTKIGLSFVAVDLKPELHKIMAPSLEKAGYRVLRINPAKADSGADHWNPLSDITDETELTELCASLLPIRDAKEAPFIEAQRDWLKAAVFHITSTPGGSLPTAFNLMSEHSDPMKLLDVLGRSTNHTAARLARRIAAGLAGGKPDPLILQGLTGALRGLDYLSLPGVQDALGHSDFSARELGKGSQPTALFLQFEEAKINALGPLLAFLATSVLTTLIDTAGDREPVALFLDELGNMPPIPNLPEKLNTIRSREIPTWMYFQTAEQMDRRYGQNADSLFFAAADFQMVFRLNEATTQKLISTLIGKTEREKFSHSKNGEQGSTTSSHEKVDVIEPWQLGELTPGEVVVLYKGAKAKGRATPHYKDFPEFKRK
ncbi:type IV secretory pathway TraG/TraD family ATPase VirD4 [Undibacterium sp. GrIS 1.2]|uniref:type IV secretory system conjugative DNA transfer family protein n=1 Tax=Undibacterium sp. GrIS 1.2 TaxID=3143933 RepID=UPI003399A5FC